MIAIYTDWSALNNPWRWWWAFIVVDTQTWKQLTQQSGSAEHTTNNRMELQAVIEWLYRFAVSQWYPEKLLEKLLWDNGDKYDNKNKIDQRPNEWLFAPNALHNNNDNDNLNTVTQNIIFQPVIIYTDSTYVQLWITQRIDTRVARQRRLSKWWWLVKNVDLWKRLYQIVQIISNCKRQRVKAHVWNKWNEKVDQLARNTAIQN